MREDAAPMPETLLGPTEDGRGRVRVGLRDGTAMLAQRQLRKGFGNDVRVLCEHIRTIYEEREPDAGVRHRPMTRSEALPISATSRPS
jgi:hypothetical protein